MRFYPEANAFVRTSFAKSSKFSDELQHFWRTVYWLKKLYPKVDEAMLIAAVSHDIERAFRTTRPKGFVENATGFVHRPTVLRHCRIGAGIIGDYLKKIGAPTELIRKVTMMVSGHEFGGNKWQNLLKDADSISYFENQYKRFIRKWAPAVDESKIRRKFDWMYQRITSHKAKVYAKPMYNKAIDYLNEFYQSN